MATLQHIDTVPDSMGPLDDRLAQEAFDLFHYQPGVRANSGAREQTRLITGLLEMGVKPFTPQSVARYKREQIRKKWWKMFAWQALAALVAGGGAALMRLAPVGWIGGIGFMLGVGALIGFVASIFVYEPSNWEWHAHLIGDYVQPIPTHILALAVGIRKAMPYCSLNVEVLQVRRETYDPDPFLVVSLGSGAAAHVAVWDEPSFTAK